MPFIIVWREGPVYADNRRGWTIMEKSAKLFKRKCDASRYLNIWKPPQLGFGTIEIMEVDDEWTEEDVRLKEKKEGGKEHGTTS
jgi:hypothetical protein